MTKVYTSEEVERIKFSLYCLGSSVGLLAISIIILIFGLQFEDNDWKLPLVILITGLIFLGISILYKRKK
jgi:membrane-bound ClpP family serine protease